MTGRLSTNQLAHTHVITAESPQQRRRNFERALPPAGFGTPERVTVKAALDHAFSNRSEQSKKGKTPPSDTERRSGYSCPMQSPDFDPTTNAILHVIKTSLGCEVTVGVEQDPETGPVYLISARKCGETWTARHEDPYGAAVALAELLGMDLEG